MLLPSNSRHSVGAMDAHDQSAPNLQGSVFYYLVDLSPEYLQLPPSVACGKLCVDSATKWYTVVHKWDEVV